MTEVTVSFTEEEYRELAKLATIGKYVTFSQVDYEYRELADKLMEKICKHGFKHMPEGEFFIKENPDNLLNLPVPEFSISNQLHDECEELEREHVKRDGQEEFVDWMAMRDFTEKYGKMDDEDVLNNPDYLGFVLDRQTEYRQEFLFNGVMNLRVVK